MIELTKFGISPHLEKRLAAIRVAQTGGVWYWYPTPGGWELQPFPSGDNEAVFHAWEFETVVDMMAQAWGIQSLPLNRDTYQGIPRGRISRGPMNTWIMEHGGEFSTRYPKQVFGLTGSPVKEEITEHHQVKPRDSEIIEKTLLYYTQNNPQVVDAFNALKQHRVATTTKTVTRQTLASMRLSSDFTEIKTQL